jgi:molybdopterin-guanine dinucleotide biosynthesis protein B
MDLVLVEGFKLAEKPKIEILRAASNAVPFCRGDRNLIALVTDTDTDLGVPRFDLNDISRIADFLEEKFLQK